MKKSKLLSGIGVMFASAVIALGTMFTSCEKEEFNVNVDPAKAQATVSAIVLYIEDGVTKDVTSDSETHITIESYTKEGNPTLPEQKVKITATYKKSSGSVTVTIPELKAGQIVNVTGTITLEAPEEKYTIEYTTEPGGTRTVTEPTGETLKNTEKYNVKEDGTYIVKSGTKVLEKVIRDNVDVKTEELVEITNYFNTLNDTYTEKTETAEVTIWAYAQKQPTVTYTVADVTYRIYRKVVETKAEPVELAYAKVEEYQTTVYNGNNDEECPQEEIPGFGHQPMNHEHSHGASNNSGGGNGQSK